VGIDAMCGVTGLGRWFSRRFQQQAFDVFVTASTGEAERREWGRVRVGDEGGGQRYSPKQAEHNDDQEDGHGMWKTEEWEMGRQREGGIVQKKRKEKQLRSHRGVSCW